MLTDAAHPAAFAPWCRHMQKGNDTAMQRTLIGYWFYIGKNLAIDKPTGTKVCCKCAHSYAA
jgi:hypothetical protein